MNATLDFDTDSDGARRLTDRRFEGLTFLDLELHPTRGSRLLLERVSFVKCRTHPGTCWISGGTTLRDVVIEDMDCGDALRISSNCQLERVILRSRKKTRSLVVRPFERDDPRFQQHTNDWCLDVAEFHGHDVEVIGIPADKIRIAPARQVVVCTDWRTRFDWQAIGLKRLGFFGIVTKKLLAHNVGAGVFSLPDPKRSPAHYDEAIREMDILRRAGA